MNDQSPTQAVLGTPKHSGYVINMRVRGSMHNPVHALTYVLSNSKTVAFFKAYAEEKGYVITGEVNSQSVILEGHAEELQLWASPITIF